MEDDIKVQSFPTQRKVAVPTVYLYLLVSRVIASSMAFSTKRYGHVRCVVFRWVWFLLSARYRREVLLFSTARQDAEIKRQQR